MLVLSRKLNEKIQLGDNITVTVLRVQGNTIRLGIDAPRDVRILRGELEPLDSHRKTKDEVFTAIPDNGSAEPAAVNSPTEPQAGKESGESETDPAPAARPPHRRGQTSVNNTVNKTRSSASQPHASVSIGKAQISGGKPRAAAPAVPAAVSGVRPELERALSGGRPLASFVAAHKPTASL